MLSIDNIFTPAWNNVDQMRFQLLQNIAGSLANRMQMDPPPIRKEEEFLKDFLVAEYKRQERVLN